MLRVRSWIDRMTPPRDNEGIAMRTAALIVKTCPVCGGPRFQKHMEVCPGPMQRIAEPKRPEPCDCNSGGMHEPDCVLVTGDEAA